MKEILFRAKRKRSGEWVYGSLISAGDYCCILESEENVHPMNYPYLDSDLGVIDGQLTPVIPETICQFTGFIGKYGTKVFEGDIVYNGSGNPGVVKWDSGEFLVYFSEEDVWSIYRYVHEGYTEVIGNIHDCPKLIDRILVRSDDE